MTIASTTRLAGPFVGNGVTILFPFAFKVFATSDIVAKLTVIASGAESTLVLTTDYTVALNADQNANPGGTVTYNPLGVPMPATQKLTLTSGVQQLQTLDLTNGGGFFPAAIANALDRAIILIQQLALTISRSLTASVSDTAPGPLPTAAARALNFLAFDAAGNPIASAGGASTPVSAAMAPVVSATTLVAAQAALFASTATLPAAVSLTGIVTAAQIVANTNDYAPANFSTASLLRISSDAARNITGIAGGSSGRLMALRNVGAFSITLKDDDAGSTAANRMALAGDYVLAVDQSVLLEYDATSSRWMLYGQQGSAAIPLSTVTTAGDIIYATGSGAVTRLPIGTALQTLRTNAGATAPEWATPSGITLGTPAATASGTSIDYTGLPAGLKRVTTSFNATSTNGSSAFSQQVGPSGGIVSAGYLGCSRIGATGTAYTDRFGLTNAGNPAQTWCGISTLTLVNSANNTWAFSSVIAAPGAGTGEVYCSGGVISLAGALSRIRYTTVSADTFDGGELNMMTEG